MLTSAVRATAKRFNTLCCMHGLVLPNKDWFLLQSVFRRPASRLLFLGPLLGSDARAVEVAVHRRKLNDWTTFSILVLSTSPPLNPYRQNPVCCFLFFFGHLFGHLDLPTPANYHINSAVKKFFDKRFLFFSLPLILLLLPVRLA